MAWIKGHALWQPGDASSNEYPAPALSHEVLLAQLAAVDTAPSDLLEESLVDWRKSRKCQIYDSNDLSCLTAYLMGWD